MHGTELHAGTLSRPSAGLFSSLFSSCFAVLYSDPVLIFYEDKGRQQLKDTWPLGMQTVCSVTGRTILVRQAERSLKLRASNASDASVWHTAIRTAVELAHLITVSNDSDSPQMVSAVPDMETPSSTEKRPRLTSYEMSGALVGGVELGGTPDPQGTAQSLAPAASDPAVELASMSDGSDACSSGDEGGSAPPLPIATALKEARAAAEACGSAEESGGEAWSAAEWSKSLELERLLAANLCTKWLDTHARALLPAQRSVAELAFVRSLGKQLASGQCSPQQLASVLGRSTLRSLADKYSSAAAALVDKPVTLDELSSKVMSPPLQTLGDGDVFDPHPPNHSCPGRSSSRRASSSSVTWTYLTRGSAP